jgi:hypothetical protein
VSSSLTDASSDVTISTPCSSACVSTRTSSDEGATVKADSEPAGTKAGAGKQPGVMGLSPFQSVL